MREASGAESPGADWSVLVSMLVLSLSEQLARCRDRLSLQELSDDCQCVRLRLLYQQSLISEWVSVDDTDPRWLLKRVCKMRVWVCELAGVCHQCNRHWNDHSWRFYSIISGILKPKPDVNTLFKGRRILPVAPRLYPIVLDKVHLPGCWDSVKGSSW